MNAIKSLLLAVMSMGLVGTASVARAEQPVEEGIVAEAEGALVDNEATEERNITESDQALSSQDWNPYDYEGFRRHGGRRECREFCQDEYFRCERFDDRFRRHGYDRDRFRRLGRCQREFNFCVRHVCGRRGGRF
ncbi:hypothetical protein [Polyangium sp. 15x6]|uniref:hypothetical protein n=1 Tax=Polyangium sp. 15x6 TaxID=3042687 RepID=UPI00249CAFB6|nr:hypothetical protein [Polyangium sp. 15x6]MDI3285647.1 hypothetical protein [Polyangium sp. 15x6]